MGTVLNLKSILELIDSIRIFLPFAGDKMINDFVQRKVTLPAKDLETITNGMSPEDKAKAKELADKRADADADFIVFVGSRGKVQPD